MKYRLVLAALTVFVASTVHAVAPHSISLGIGGVFPYTEVDTGSSGAGDQPVGDTGGILGFRYLFAATPRIDVGGSMEFSNTGKAEYTAVPVVVENYMKSTLLMVNAKIHPESTNAFVPYFLGGLGLHFTEFNVDVHPSPGFAWASGDPYETRSIVSDSQTGLALSLGVGVDYNVTPNFFLGLEGRLDILSEEEYEPTPYGTSLGYESDEIGATNGVLQLRVGYRFGKSSDDSASSASAQPKTAPAKAEGAI